MLSLHYEFNKPNHSVRKLLLLYGNFPIVDLCVRRISLSATVTGFELRSPACVVIEEWLNKPPMIVLRKHRKKNIVKRNVG